MLLTVFAQAAAAVAALAPAPAPGTTSPAPAPPPVALAVAPQATSQAGVTSYPPEFFNDVHPNTALDMIGRLPGFAIDTGNGVRGYEGAAGNVLIDGRRPAVKTEGIDQILQRVLASRVVRIDVIRGGAPGIDMQGKTVIANVITKSGGGPRGVIHVANDRSTDGRVKNTLRMEASGQVGQRTLEGGVTVGGFIDDSYGDGSLTRTAGNGALLASGHIHSQGWGTQAVATGATEAPLAGGRLRINGRLFSQTYDSAELDTFRVPDTHGEHDHQDDNKWQSELGGRYNRGFGARTNIEIVALRQDANEEYADAFDTPSDAQIFHQDTRTSETILRGVVKFQQTPKLSWEAGAEGAYNTLTNHIAFSDNGANIALPASNVRVTEKRGEVFGKAVWQPFTTITVEGAVREEGSNIASSGDVNLAKTLYYTKPRVLLTWSPSADTQVRLRYEREVGQLDFGAFTASTTLNAGVVTAGNPNLVPAQSWTSEVALEQHFWGSGGITLTVRHQELTDVVDRAPIFLPDGTAFDAPANIGDATEDDAVIDLTLPLDKLGLKGAQIRGEFTRRWSEVIDPTTHIPRGISGQRPTEWELHFIQPVGRSIYGVDVGFGNGWQQRSYRFNQIQIDKLQPYVTPYWEWKPNPGLSLRVELDNITARGFKHVFENFDGPRGLAPPAVVEQRSVHPGRLLHIRLRKTFGS
jgi:outer membrane receptor protein involved in Fe transport